MPGQDLDADDEVNMAFFKRDDKQAVTGEELMSWLERLPAGTILSLESPGGGMRAALSHDHSDAAGNRNSGAEPVQQPARSLRG